MEHPSGDPLIHGDGVRIEQGDVKPYVRNGSNSLRTGPPILSFCYWYFPIVLSLVWDQFGTVKMEMSHGACV